MSATLHLVRDKAALMSSRSLQILQFLPEYMYVQYMYIPWIPLKAAVQREPEGFTKWTDGYSWEPGRAVARTLFFFSFLCFYQFGFWSFSGPQYYLFALFVPSLLFSASITPSDHKVGARGICHAGTILVFHHFSISPFQYLTIFMLTRQPRLLSTICATRDPSYGCLRSYFFLLAMLR